MGDFNKVLRILTEYIPHKRKKKVKEQKSWQKLDLMRGLEAQLSCQVISDSGRIVATIKVGDIIQVIKCDKHGCDVSFGNNTFRLEDKFWPSKWKKLRKTKKHE